MIAFSIKENIYNIPLEVIIGTWEYQNEYLLKKYGLAEREQINFGAESLILTNKGNAITVVWLPEFKYENIDNMVTLIHELDHVGFYILEHINIPILDNSPNHAYIYLKEYFTKKALKKLKRLTNDN